MLYCSVPVLYSRRTQAKGSTKIRSLSGPDGVGDHRTTVIEQQYVGHGSASPESSSDTQYLYRAAPVRTSCVGLFSKTG